MRRMNSIRWAIFVFSSLCVLCASVVNSCPAEPFRNGVVVAVSTPGADVGVAILKKGGNAVDAAVATAFALAVTYPAAGNIGGGGFMLIYPPARASPSVIDYRETAPGAATQNDVQTDRQHATAHKAVGVPGTVRGLALAHQKFGKLPWKDVVMPAVKLAEEGLRPRRPRWPHRSTGSLSGGH